MKRIPQGKKIETDEDAVSIFELDSNIDDVPVYNFYVTMRHQGLNVKNALLAAMYASLGQEYGKYMLEPQPGFYPTKLQGVIIS